jgi:hypothetical protein
VTVWVGFLERSRLGQRLAAFARYAAKLNVAKKRPQNSVDIFSMPVIFATKASDRDGPSSGPGRSPKS